MTTTNELQHGGNLAAAERIFGPPKEGWIDLSTGISPFPYPVTDICLDAWTRLPGQTEEIALKAAACRAYGAPENAPVVMAPGTQVLIQQLPRNIEKSRVVIRTPTYGEHAFCWAQAGHVVIEASFSQLPDNADVVVVVNPNNPDGHKISAETILSWSNEMAERGGILVVDEAFADVTPELSIAKYAGRPGLVILRSFGKFFGLAGLRLGFAFSDKTITSRLSSSLGPWAVSGPALQIGAAALNDMDWQNEARHRLSTAARRLEELLSEFSIQTIGRTPLFLLIGDEHAHALYEGLASYGILVRPFDYQPNWLRFGLPALESQWQRLENALKSITR